VAFEAFLVPRCVLVRDASLVYYLIAAQTTLSVLFFIATHADNFLVTWYKALRSDWLHANLATKTLLVPLFRLVFKFLHPCSEETATPVTSRRKVVVVTVGTEQSVILVGEGFVRQGTHTVRTLEAFLMPMLVLV